jgi:hypothetical protein
MTFGVLTAPYMGGTVPLAAFLIDPTGLKIKEVVEYVFRYSIGSALLFFVSHQDVCNFVVHMTVIYLCSKSSPLVSALTPMISLFIAFSHADYLFLNTQ